MAIDWGQILSYAVPAATAAAGAISAGKQKGREATNAAAQDTSTFKLNESRGNEAAQITRANLDLNRKQDARTQQLDAYKKALQSALAMNMQDVTISGVDPSIPVVNFKGGARPSAIGKEGRSAAGILNKQAMAALMNGEQFDALPPLERTSPAAYEKPGAMENIAGMVGLAGNAVSGAQAQGQQQSFQDKILKAIESYSGGGASTASPFVPNVGSGAKGVTPFFKPPTATFQDGDYPD